MRKSFGTQAWVFPMPVFIIGTYDANGKPDAMNAAWGGISCDTEICLCLSENHKTTQNILMNKFFTVSIGTAAHIAACDYVGITSANNTPDKMEKSGLHAEKSPLVDAPLFAELPMALECKLISYDPQTCHLFGEILNVTADESILTNGKIDIAKLQPITYNPVAHTYNVIGADVGNAFKDGLALKH